MCFPAFSRVCFLPTAHDVDRSWLCPAYRVSWTIYYIVDKTYRADLGWFFMEHFCAILVTSLDPARAYKTRCLPNHGARTKFEHFGPAWA